MVNVVVIDVSSVVVVVVTVVVVVAASIVAFVVFVVGRRILGQRAARTSTVGSLVGATAGEPRVGAGGRVRGAGWRTRVQFRFARKLPPVAVVS